MPVAVQAHISRKADTLKKNNGASFFTLPFTSMFKCVWRNVGNVPSDVPRFPLRADRLIEHFHALDADVLALSECRDTPEGDGCPALPIAAFLARAAGTRYTIVNQNGAATPSSPAKAFYLSILVDHAKLLVLSSTMVPLGGSLTSQLTPGTFNRTLHALRLVARNADDGSVAKGAQPFWVVTTHLNIPKEPNTAEVRWVVDNLHKITGGEPYVLMGDFNFFPDPGRSEEQEAIMAADHDDVFADARDTVTGLPFLRTFVGFSNDPYRCADIYSTAEPPGRLDRVYIFRGDTRLRVTEPLIDTRLFLGGELVGYRKGRWEFPSDHFPLVMTVSVACSGGPL